MSRAFREETRGSFKCASEQTQIILFVANIKILLLLLGSCGLGKPHSNHSLRSNGFDHEVWGDRAEGGCEKMGSSLGRG